MENNFYTLSGYEELLNIFKNIYDIQHTYIPPIKKTKLLKPTSERICRFCGLASPKVSFKKDAHTIPYFLGNKYGLCDFECDTCNEYFSKFESHLSYYLGITQSLSKRQELVCPHLNQRIRN